METLGDLEFLQISTIALEDAGLRLPAGKRSMVASRILRRMRASACPSIEEYFRRLSGPNSIQERRELVSVLTTNVTSFFREAHHFETLRTKVLPSLLQQARAGRRVRIWSAGCSTGQEAFSLATLLVHLDPRIVECDIRILATDIDHVVLENAKRATYPASEFAQVPPEMRRLLTDRGVLNGDVILPEAIRRLVTFRKLNLHDAWPMHGLFDIVFCRNVVIYFDAEHQASLWPRFNAIMPIGAWLFLGHSERLHPIEGSGFKASGVTTYQKTGAWTGKNNLEGQTCL